MKLLTRPEDTTVGCDPEVFFIKDGNIFPAVGLIGGNKDSPMPCKGGALQEDNVMAEFNTDPETTVDGFLARISEVYEEVEAIAFKNGCTVGKQASKQLHPITLIACAQSKEFGCDPDFNAYTNKINRTPDPESLLRTCAGHIHLGYDVEGGHSLERSSELVKYLDAYLGTYCVVTDRDSRRMSRYGKAGAFRPKSYGTEYRVPSNFWVFSKELTTEVFNRVREGYEACKKGVQLPHGIQHAINTQNINRCEEILLCLER